jgi:hypothetical protein
MANTPNFEAKRRKLEPVTFVPAEQFFKPQVKVQATRDINGWADPKRRVKWSIAAHSIVYMDTDKAREFQIKGYVRVLDGQIEPASDDEVAEILSSVTTLSLGAN